MTTKRKINRELLRTRIIDAAEEAISQNGLSGLKARDVTARAGCALGALYNVVEDIDELIVLVNSRTLRKMGAVLKQAVDPDSSPSEVMQALARAYTDFALANTPLWTAIFNHRLPEGKSFPDWHQAEYPMLIAEIIAPLSKLRPDLGPEALLLRAQTLFASVHGVIQLAIHGRFVGVPLTSLKSEIEALVHAMTRGSHLVNLG